MTREQEQHTSVVETIHIREKNIRALQAMTEAALSEQAMSSDVTDSLRTVREALSDGSPVVLWRFGRSYTALMRPASEGETSGQTFARTGFRQLLRGLFPDHSSSTGGTSIKNPYSAEIRRSISNRLRNGGTVVLEPSTSPAPRKV